MKNRCTGHSFTSGTIRTAYREVKDVRDYEYSGCHHIKTGRCDIIHPPDDETKALFELFSSLPLEGQKINILVA